MLVSKTKSSPKYQIVAHNNYLKIRRSPTTATLVSSPYRFDPSRAVFLHLTIDVTIFNITIIIATIVELL